MRNAIYVTSIWH